MGVTNAWWERGSTNDFGAGEILGWRRREKKEVINSEILLRERSGTWVRPLWRREVVKGGLGGERKAGARVFAARGGGPSGQVADL